MSSESDDAAERAAAHWRLEPELANSTVPRQLERKPIPFSRIAQTVLIIALVGLTAWFTFPLFRARYIHRNGLRTIGHVRDGQLYSGRHSTTHLWVDFTTESGRMQEASVDMPGVQRALIGHNIWIYYLPNDPSQIAPTNSASNLPIVICVIVLVAGVLGFQLVAQRRKTLFLLRSGQAVRTTVDQLESPSRGSVTAHLIYATADTSRIFYCSVARNANLKPGDVVTAFVHDRYPEDAVIYRLCPYQVIR